MKLNHLISVKCNVNKYLYKFGGMKKVNCTPEFDKDLINHLPNLSTGGAKGRNNLRCDKEPISVALNRLFNKL